MKWHRGRIFISFERRDFAVISACNLSFDELINKKGVCPGIPPARSVIAYELFRNPTTSPHRFWRDYRESRALVAERDKHYLSTRIRKNTTGVRTLSVPDWSIAKHQRYMLQEVFNYLPVSDCAVAYRNGHNIRDCAEPHVGQETLIHLDIKDFFPSIKEQTVFEALLRETGYPKSLVGFMSALCCYKGSLPQGACTSPILSNICFRPCDDELEKFAEEHALVYTRYSDDLFFSGSVKDVGEMIRAVSAILRSYGFRINRDKTKVLHRGCAQRVLGLTVNERVQASRKYRRNLRQELHYLHRFGQDADGARAAEDYLHYLYMIAGKISFVLSADPDNKEFREEKRRISELIHKYESEYLW